MARRKLFQSLTRMPVKFVASAQSDEEPREREREKGEPASRRKSYKNVAWAQLSFQKTVERDR